MTNTRVAAYPLTASFGDHPPAADSLAPAVRFAARCVRFVGVMLFFAAASAFTQSSFFAITEITVQGTRRLSESALISRSGLFPGQVLSSIRPSAVAARLDALPWVAAARVRVRPTGRVDLVIDERVAIAALPYRAKYILLDANGVAIETQSTPPAVPVISIEGEALPWLRLGDLVPSRKVRDAVQVLVLMPREEVARGLHLRIDRSGTVSVKTADGVTVLLGPPRGLGARAAVLPQVLAAIRRQHVREAIVDLRYAGSVILRGQPATLVKGVRH